MFSRNPFDLNFMAFKFNSHDRNKPLQCHVTPTFRSLSSKNAQFKLPAGTDALLYLLHVWTGTETRRLTCQRDR